MAVPSPDWGGGHLDSSEGLLIANKKEKVQYRESRGKERQIQNVTGKVHHVGLQVSVSCRGLQMAFRIKSKLCWLPRNRLCITAGSAGAEEKAATEGARAAATVWKSLSNEFLKYLKINCLWKKVTTWLIRRLDGGQKKSGFLLEFVLIWVLFHTLFHLFSNTLFPGSPSHLDSYMKWLKG